MRGVARKDGKVRWTSTFREFTKGNRWFFVEEGSGIRSPYDFETRWKVELEFAVGEFIRPEWIRNSIYRPDGSIVAVETKSYDFEKRFVQVQRTDGKGKTLLDQTFSIPADTVGSEGLGVPFRSLPFESGEPFVFHLFTAEPRLYKITAKFLGKEIVRTPAGSFETYKVEMIPDLGVLGLLNAFVPKTYMWQMVKNPHTWVKYQGLEIGLNTPEVDMELTH